MKDENKVRTWVRSVAVGFLCVTATVTFAIAGGHVAKEQAVAPASVTGWVPPLHEAEAGADVGPGSDEGLLVGSPMPE